MRIHHMAGVLLFIVPAVLGIGPALASAQDAEARSARNAFYLDLGGFGDSITDSSYNYEHRIAGPLLARIGYSTTADSCFLSFSIGCRDVEVNRLILMATVLTGKANHHLEAGAGLRIGEWDDGSFTGCIGYRRQPPDGGFVVRLAGCVIQGPYREYELMQGLSLGWAW